MVAEEIAAIVVVPAIAENVPDPAFALDFILSTIPVILYPAYPASVKVVLLYLGVLLLRYLLVWELALHPVP